MRHTRIIVTRYGGPDTLRVIEEECPEPKSGEVRVRVLAAGVSLPDLLMREGVHPETRPVPFTPGGIWSAWWIGSAPAPLASNRARSLPRCRSAVRTPSSSACRNMSWFRCHRVGRRRGGQPRAELRHGVPDAAPLRQGQTGPARVDLRRGGRGRFGARAAWAARTGWRCTAPALARGVGRFRPWRRPDRLPASQDFVREIRRLTGEGVDVVFDGIGGTHIWRSRKALRRGGRVVAYGLTSSLRGGRLASRSSSSLSRNRHLRAVHRWRLASPGPETGGALQHPVAQAAEAGIVSARFDHLVRPASTAEDQAARRAAISACRGKRAHELLGKGGVTGKIVLVCDGSSIESGARNNGVTERRRALPLVPTVKRARRSPSSVLSGRSRAMRDRRNARRRDDRAF